MNNKTYLSDWLEDKLTDDQLKQIVSNEDFLAFKKIKETLNDFSIKDENLEHNFSAIKSKLQSAKKIEPNVFPLYKYVSIAATILVLIGTYFYCSTETYIKTTFGQKQNITLADNSKVILNAKSQLGFSLLFKYKRNLSLDGEAFFKVQKGSKFTVTTTLGKVEVLGTKFNVISNDDYFEVMCYEGKVRVSTLNKKVILTQGESVRFYNNQFENWIEENNEQPSWINNESSFKNTPLKQVFSIIENQYGIKINYPKNIENTTFSGAISNENLILALKTVCITTHLKFKKINTSQIEITNE